MEIYELEQEVYGNLTTAVSGAAPFKELQYRLPDTGFDPACRPVRLAEIKDQRLPHEREDWAPGVRRGPGRPKSDGLPAKVNFETAQARAAVRSAERARLNSGYLDVVSGGQDEDDD